MARVLRVALRETVFIGAIVVLAVWATQSFFSRYSPDKVRALPSDLQDLGLMRVETSVTVSACRQNPLATDHISGPLVRKGIRVGTVCPIFKGCQNPASCVN
jgi:hypothetical protein